MEKHFKIIANTLGTDSGIETCSRSVASNGLDDHHHRNNHSNSDTTSAIDLSEVHMQEDIPHDDDDGNNEIDERVIEGGPVQMTPTRITSTLSSAKRLSNRISTDSGSTFEIVDYQSPSESIDDGDGWSTSIVVGNDNLSPNEAGTSSVNTLVELVNVAINKATLSDKLSQENGRNMVRVDSCGSSSNGGGGVGVTVEELLNEENNLQRRRLYNNSKSSTKAEKQRQNEEIVILESSSVSSETGSWESVFPQSNQPVELKDSCRDFLLNEKKISQSMTPASSASSAEEKLLRGASSVSACFIDASSLLDDTEITYLPSSTATVTAVNPIDESINLLGPSASVTGKGQLNDDVRIVDSVEEEREKVKIDSSEKNPIDLFDSFHENFAKCKIKKSAKSPSPVDEVTNVMKPPDSPPSKIIEYDIKDQYSSGEFTPLELSSSSAKLVALVKQQPQPLIGNLDLEDSTRLAKLRKECERKQGNLVFQNSIQQYSGHLISPKVMPEDNFSDVSMPSIYSTSSDPNYDYSSIFETSGSQYSTGDYFGSGNYSRMTSEVGSVIYPDTPHNSIINFEIDTSGKNDHGSDKSDKSDKSVHEDEQIGGIKVPKRVQKCDESAPILSGGVSVKDFTPKQCESPLVRRKTDTCPIISGGITTAEILEEPKKVNMEKPNLSSSVASWIVDMSDCKSNDHRQRTSSSSSSNENAKSIDSERLSTSSMHKSGLGFFVEFKQESKPIKTVSDVSLDNEKIVPTVCKDNMKRSTGFFIDFSDNDSATVTPPPTKANQTPPINNDSNDKKNIFSMFIDFGEKKQIPKKEPLSFTSRLSNSIMQRKENESNSRRSESPKSGSSTDSPMMIDKDKDSRLKYSPPYLSTIKNDLNGKGEIDENVSINRRFRSPAQKNSNESKRHSWNTSNNGKLPDKHDKPSDVDGDKQHKRSASLSTDKGIMSILDKIPLLSKTSSMSIDSSLSPFEDFTCSKSEISSYSNNSNSVTSESIHSSLGSKHGLKIDVNTEQNKVRRHRKDVKINETFDKSSQGSITDGILSKDTSPTSTTTDTDDVTFQNEVDITIQQEVQMSLKENGKMNGNVIMETILESKETNQSPKKLNSSRGERIETHTMETLQATIERQKQLLETVNENTEPTSFVRLSDLDKPVASFELYAATQQTGMSNSAGSNRISKLFIETSSKNNTNLYERHSWNMSRSTGNNFINLASSVENSRSLSRLFPHLSKVFSNSLPTDVGLEVYNKGIHETHDYISSDFSGGSSVTSSISRSGLDSADESSISCRQPRRLGEDLLKMFLQEIATDVLVDVGGRKIRAHKCILRSRCQYFAAILAGGWVQTAGNIISLPGYSYEAVHFALCHIYSGASHPPEGISLMELAALSDLLGLEGLKEVTTYALKTNYCHNFHKPCSGCIEGIMQVLPVSLNHGLDDLYRKCLKWTCKHYVKVWPTRPFALLSSDLVQRCKQQIVAHLSSETVLNTILECEQLLTILAPCRWALNVENVVRDILDATDFYISEHFASLIASDSFLSLGHDQSWNITRLENILLRTASTLSPDQACRSYQRATRLNKVLGAKVITVPAESKNMYGSGGTAGPSAVHEEEMDWSDEFIRLVSAIVSAVEQCLTRQCSRAMRVSAWQRMDLDLRKKIQKLACLSDPMDERRSRVAHRQVSYQPPSYHNRTQDLHQVRLAIQAHSKRASSQDGHQYKASAHTQTHNHEHNHSQNHQKKDKSVQANQDLSKNLKSTVEKNIGTGKISKSSSKVQVPESTVKPITLEKINILGHRRSHSEHTTHTKETSQHSSKLPSIRLSDVKPRYLEPKKPIAVIKTASNTNLHVKAKQLSSSESSTRTSSPMANKRRVATNRQQIADSNMSLDSLASPAKINKCLRSRNYEQEIDVSVDSLADSSMKSSQKTDKTVSQESLVVLGTVSHHNLKENQSSSSLKLAGKTPFSKSNPVINKENTNRQSGIPNKQIKTKSTQSTTGSSPSALLAKNGKLSRNSSVSSSPRDAFRNRIPLTTTASTSSVRKSFLSARSKEILLKRAQNDSKSSISDDNKEDTKSLSEIDKRFINKSSSTSNIPNRRVVNTTLHIRRTAKVTNVPTMPAVNVTKNSNSNKLNGKVNNEIVNINNIDNKMKKNVVTKKQQSNIAKEVEVIIGEEEKPDVKFESKLERSSTFCKESSDIPGNELQIIE